jgi:hypothetical protein
VGGRNELRNGALVEGIYPTSRWFDNRLWSTSCIPEKFLSQAIFAYLAACLGKIGVLVVRYERSYKQTITRKRNLGGAIRAELDVRLNDRLPLLEEATGRWFFVLGRIPISFVGSRVTCVNHLCPTVVY